MRRTGIGRVGLVEARAGIEADRAAGTRGRDDSDIHRAFAGVALAARGGIVGAVVGDVVVAGGRRQAGGVGAIDVQQLLERRRRRRGQGIGAAGLEQADRHRRHRRMVGQREIVEPLGHVRRIGRRARLFRRAIADALRPGIEIGLRAGEGIAIGRPRPALQEIEPHADTVARQRVRQRQQAVPEILAALDQGAALVGVLAEERLEIGRRKLQPDRARLGRGDIAVTACRIAKHGETELACAIAREQRHRRIILGLVGTVGRPQRALSAEIRERGLPRRPVARQQRRRIVGPWQGDRDVDDLVGGPPAREVVGILNRCRRRIVQHPVAGHVEIQRVGKYRHGTPLIFGRYARGVRSNDGSYLLRGRICPRISPSGNFSVSTFTYQRPANTSRACCSVSVTPSFTVERSA